LTPAERAFVRESAPWGLIVFKRNIEAPAQVARLAASFRDAVGRDAAVLVDQEGGRVQRLGPPHWPAYPPGASYGRIYDRDRATGLEAARLGAHLIAADLKAVGIDVDCLPIADVPVAGADLVIGDRAYGDTADKVAAIARAVADGLQAGGVLPVLDTDRATLVATDFAAFRPLSDLPLGMTAHIVYSAIDPIAPATTSVTLVRDVIRGLLQFCGLLMSDDISMGALSGPIEVRSRAAIAAGCDLVLHCNGKLDEMQAVASAVPMLTGEAAARSDAALRRRGQLSQYDPGALRAEWTALMAAPAGARRATS
jgi:beta-N-acetylhexosaminidase